MVLRPLRSVPLPDASAATYNRWLGEVEERLSEPTCDRYALCREILFDLYYPGLGTYEDVVADPNVPDATRGALLALDPHNITTEPEYYREIDPDRYAVVKPLLWLWQHVDRSPLGGGNVDVAVRFRRLLAKHVFKRCGARFKCFQFVEFSFGYNMEVGDDCVVHRHVLLDDRGGIVMGNKVSIADYANVYSHSHALENQEDVTDAAVTLEDGVRITYHATILAGVRVGTQAMIGAGAVLTKDARPWWLYLGVPARPIRPKPNAPPEALAESGG